MQAKKNTPWAPRRRRVRREGGALRPAGCTPSWHRAHQFDLDIRSARPVFSAGSGCAPVLGSSRTRGRSQAEGEGMAARRRNAGIRLALPGAPRPLRFSSLPSCKSSNLVGTYVPTAPCRPSRPRPRLRGGSPPPTAWSPVSDSHDDDLLWRGGEAEGRETARQRSAAQGDSNRRRGSAPTRGAPERCRGRNPRSRRRGRLVCRTRQRIPPLPSLDTGDRQLGCAVTVHDRRKKSAYVRKKRPF